jgi:PAS domain S-box-containing protein
MKRILLADDEVIITMQLETRLKSMGYDVVGVAASGQESFDLARKLRPDLVIMDIVMPGEMDGIDAAALIRAELDIPIIFLTAFADENNLLRAKNTEPFGYIVKPFHEKEIHAAIEMALQRKMMEKRLRANEKKYFTIMRDAFDPIIIADIGGKILEVNNRAARFLGYKKDTLIGMEMKKLYPSEERKRAFKVFSETLRKNRGIVRNARVLTSEGREMAVDISKSAVEYGGERVILQILNVHPGEEHVEKTRVKLFRGTQRSKNEEREGTARGPAGGTAKRPKRAGRDSSSSQIPETAGADGESLPVCASCKKVLNETGKWVAFETYFQDQYSIDFERGICSECAHRLWPDMPADLNDMENMQ